jgi:hypothetical protein
MPLAPTRAKLAKLPSLADRGLALTGEARPKPEGDFRLPKLGIADEDFQQDFEPLRMQCLQFQGCKPDQEETR